MAKELYCWRCRTVVPMLEEGEYARPQQLLWHSIRDVKQYRKEHSVSIEVAQLKAQQPALDVYFEIAGYRETNVIVLYHHRLSLFGPACRACGKPLRTPKSKHCAACGTVRETEAEQMKP